MIPQTIIIDWIRGDLVIEPVCLFRKNALLFCSHVTSLMCDWQIACICKTTRQFLDFLISLWRLQTLTFSTLRGTSIFLSFGEIGSQAVSCSANAVSSPVYRLVSSAKARKQVFWRESAAHANIICDSSVFALLIPERAQLSNCLSPFKSLHLCIRPICVLFILITSQRCQRQLTKSTTKSRRSARAHMALFTKPRIKRATA